jgi:hypothetical protein
MLKWNHDQEKEELIIRVATTCSKCGTSELPQIPRASSDHIERVLSQIESSQAALLAATCAPAPSQATNDSLVSELSSLGRRYQDCLLELGQLRAQVDMFRGAFDREQKSLVQTVATNRIGKDGEEWVFKMLSLAIGKHAHITDTSNMAGCGDIQIKLLVPGESRPVLITVESKHSEANPLPLMKKSCRAQARKQIKTQKADAGVLLYTGPIKYGQTLEVEHAERLVVVGNCREEGQLFTGMLYALSIAMQNMRNETAKDDGLLRLDQQTARELKAMTCAAIQLAGDARRSLHSIRQAATSASNQHRDGAVNLIDRAAAFEPEVASLLVPGSIREILSVPAERLPLQKRPEAKKKRKCPDDGTVFARLLR